MKIEEQVVSFELAKNLKELGVKQESLFWYDYNGKLFLDEYLPHPWKSGEFKSETEGMYSAFTAAELGEIIPSRINRDLICYRKNEGTADYRGYWAVLLVDYYDAIERKEFMQYDTEANCKGEFLIHLIENKLMEEK